MLVEEVTRGVRSAAVGAALDEQLDQGEVVMHDGEVQADLCTMARSGQTSPWYLYYYSLLTTHYTYHSLLTSPWYGWPMYEASSTLTSVPSTSGVRCASSGAAQAKQVRR